MPGQAMPHAFGGKQQQRTLQISPLAAAPPTASETDFQGPLNMQLALPETEPLASSQDAG